MSQYSTLQTKCLSVFSSFLCLTTVLTAKNAVAQAVPSTAQNPEAVQPNEPTVKQRQRSLTPVFSGQQMRSDAIVPVGNEETISKIVVRFVDADGNLTKGKTKPNVITREFALQPGDIYNEELAREGLRGVLDLTIIDRASLTLEKTTGNQAIMAIAVEEGGRLSIGFSLTLPPPTALQGPIKPITVNAISDSPPQWFWRGSSIWLT